MGLFSSVNLLLYCTLLTVILKQAIGSCRFFVELLVVMPISRGVTTGLGLPVTSRHVPSGWILDGPWLVTWVITDDDIPTHIAIRECGPPETNGQRPIRHTWYVMAVNHPNNSSTCLASELRRS